MVEDGADIIDIGGESTRPGYEKISDEEEIARAKAEMSAQKEAVKKRAVPYFTPQIA